MKPDTTWVDKLTGLEKMAFEATKSSVKSGWKIAWMGVIALLDEEKTLARREGIKEAMRVVEKMKAEHDVEKDPSGVYSVCLICNEKGASDGEYCEGVFNGTLDATLQALQEKLDTKGE